METYQEFTANGYQRFCEQSIDPFYCVNFEGKIRWANRAFARALGKTPEGLVDQDLIDLVAAEDQESTRKVHRDMVELGCDVLQFRNRYRSDNGRFKVFDWSHRVERETKLIYSAGRDLTHRLAELHRREQELRSLYEESPVILCSLDRRRNVETVSNRWLATTGYRRDEVVGAHFRELFASGCRDTIDIVDAQLNKDGVCEEIPCRLRKKDGGLIDVLVSARAERNTRGESFRYHYVLTDISERVRAQQELERQRVLLEAFFNAVPDATVIAGPDRRIALANAAVTDIFGYSPEELIGQTTETLYASHEDYVEQGHGGHNPSLSGKAHTYRVQYRRKDGQAFPADTVGATIRTPSNVVLGYLGLIRDVSDRVAAEKAIEVNRQRAEAIANALPDMVMRMDRQGTILDLKEGHGIPLFAARDEAVGKRLSELPVPEWLQEKAMESVRSVLDGGAMVAYEYGAHLEGRDLEFEARIVRSGDDEVICLVRDITERKRSEKALREANMLLETSNTRLKQFVNLASHDLQEPLRTISSFCQLLQMKYQDKVDAEGKKYIEFAVDGAARMRALIRDLLMYSRMEQDEEPLAAVNGQDALNEAKRNLQAVIEETGAIITQDELPMVRFSHRQLVQVFQNLIGNALKYKSQETPTVHLGAAREGQFWRLSVEDNGIGIAPQYQDRIFELFQRLHGKGEYEGTGIGLAICKLVIERTGGRVWVESQQGTGSTFYFTLPCIAGLVK